MEENGGAALRREDVWEGKCGSTALSTSTEQAGSREGGLGRRQITEAPAHRDYGAQRTAG